MNMQHDKFVKRIRNAGIAGSISTGGTFLRCLLSASEHKTMDFFLWGPAFISLILTIWIFKRSRVAATWMIVYFAIDTVARFWIFRPSLFDVVSLAFLYFYVQGARATFALHRLKPSQATPPALTTELRHRYVAVASGIAVVLLLLVLPIKLIKSYLDTRPSRYPLLIAVAKGDLAGIDDLIRQGEDINQSTPLGTPLNVAARTGRPQVIRSLIDHGAMPNLPDWKQWAPLHSTIASARTNLEAIVTLVENGADVNIQDKHLRTPLHRAAQFGHANAVRLLLSLGADPDAKDENGYTPFDRADRHSNIQTILQEATKAKADRTAPRTLP
jgi:hypothetical protein